MAAFFMQYQLTAQEILFEDQSLIVVNKPSGLPTQATLDPSRDHLFAAVARYLGPQAYVGLHHRLDVQTSGVVLFTKQRSANVGVSALFQTASVHKRYRVIAYGACGVPETFVLNKAIGELKHSKPQRFTCKNSGARPALTQFALLAAYPFGEACVYEILAEPKTGRTHQIRVHLGDFGLSIVGDSLYGQGRLPLRVRGFAPKRMCLHAESLQFAHPMTGEQITVNAAIPPCFAAFVKHCKELADA